MQYLLLLLLTLSMLQMRSCAEKSSFPPADSVQVLLEYNGKFTMDKPPLVTVYLDLQATNPTSTFQWVLIPKNISDTAVGLSGISSVTRFHVENREEMELFTIACDRSSFFAIPVPGRSRISLTNMQMRSWDWPSLKDSIKVSYFMATEIQISAPALQIELDSFSKPSFQDFSADFGQFTRASSATNGNMESVATLFADSSRHKACVLLQSKKK